MEVEARQHYCGACQLRVALRVGRTLAQSYTYTNPSSKRTDLGHMCASCFKDEWRSMIRRHDEDLQDWRETANHDEWKNMLWTK